MALEHMDLKFLSRRHFVHVVNITPVRYFSFLFRLWIAMFEPAHKGTISWSIPSNPITTLDNG